MSLTPEKMEPSKQFMDLTWADLTKVGKSSQQSTILGRCPSKAVKNLPWKCQT